MSNEDIKKLMLFIGYNFVTVGYFGSDDETEWQINNKEWMDKVGMNSVGDYFVNEDGFIDLYNDRWSNFIDFSKDWNWLIKVAKKLKINHISTDISIAYNDCYHRINK